ncbi:unnamed protein product [Ostreobium quekettii]|uniref:Uncharacterized protein n=1 Tax=Ostreobium quekettii TaxID=121088 RepID=A0A8S1IP14_9CHLO|nr:unnamed protein product [Ostreobium quekettii]
MASSVMRTGVHLDTINFPITAAIPANVHSQGSVCIKEAHPVPCFVVLVWNWIGQLAQPHIYVKILPSTLLRYLQACVSANRDILLQQTSQNMAAQPMHSFHSKFTPKPARGHTILSICADMQQIIHWFLALSPLPTLEEISNVASSSHTA